MKKKVIIVGGVAGGASTAARLRRLDENIEILMIEKGEYISFANCGLPYYIGEKIQSRDSLIVQTVEEMSEKFNLDIRNLSEVIEIDKEKKLVKIKKVKTGEVYEENYDVLVLSPGASPLKPNIKGINEANNLFTLRNIPDTDKIKAFVDNNKIRKATVIGGGFIGLEMAENLHRRGIEVTIVEASSQVMAPVDMEMASIIHEHIIDKDVNLILEDGVSEFENSGKTIVLRSGKEIETELIILSIGVRPETTIAKTANLELNERGAIVVNDNMRTSDENIYALGDAVEVVDFVNGNKTMIPLAWPANRQGRIVANNICGRNEKYKGTLGSSVAQVFDYTVASTGNNEKTLERLGLEFKAMHIHPGSHAGYYPGSFPIAYKLLFNPSTGKIYGAQGVGFNGVEKRIDVIATAIKANLKVTDLQDVEPCYAPPYNSAKDPVNMFGYLADSIMNGDVKTIDFKEIDNIDKNTSIILDVREEFELILGTIENSIHIPLGDLRNRINELPKDKTIYTLCQVGQRGYVASRILTQKGYDAINIDGGMKTYSVVKKAEKALKKYNFNNSIIKAEKEVAVMEVNREMEITKSLNACGLQCPGPIKKVFEEINGMKDGESLKITASDPGFKKDIASWCEKTGNTLIKAEFNNDKNVEAVIQKGNNALMNNSDGRTIINNKDGATMVVFSGDLDKAIASFIIATGSASMGKKVTMFFTFWGLSVIKKQEKVKVKKNVIEKMFDIMLPRRANKLPLSKMNMAGMGPIMIKKIMKDKNVDSIDILIKNAMDMGVNLVACTMSMDLMGIKEAELLEGVEFGGVASYLGAAEDSGVNLFI